MTDPDEIRDIIDGARKRALGAVLEVLKRAAELVAEGGRHDLMNSTALACECAAIQIRDYLALRRRVLEELAKHERPTVAVPVPFVKAKE